MFKNFIMLIHSILVVSMCFQSVENNVDPEQKPADLDLVFFFFFFFFLKKRKHLGSVRQALNVIYSQWSCE